jgi:branched-chain amino acid transport system substrate-binding protein
MRFNLKWANLKWLGVALYPALLAALTGLGAAPAAAQELRIGFIAPFTGGFAQQGADMKAGFEMYLEEVKGKFGGAKVTVIYEDDQAVVATGVTKAEKLISQDKVHLFMGGVLAPTGYALAPVSTRHDIPYVMPVAAADDLTQRKKAEFPYLVRTGWTGSQTTHVLGQWACDQGYKKVSVVAADYAFGHESVGGFQRVFEACGGQVVQKIWPPLGNKDFGPFLSQIRGDVDAVFTMMVGPMIAAFPKQYAQSGFKKPLIGQGTGADEATLGSMGDESIGYVTAQQYAAGIDTPRNAAFVKKFRSLYNKQPGYYAETCYTTALWIDEVMKQVKGQWPGTVKFVHLMKTTQLKSTPRGPVRLDDYGSPVQTIYIRKVAKTKMFGYPNDELWNTVIKTYPNVGQFWTIKPEVYLAEPLYSRDYPPCKFCK